MITWDRIRNPILNLHPKMFLRDPALVYHDETFHCFHSAGVYNKFKYQFYLHVTRSKDLVNWTRSELVIDSKAGFSSPGNAIKVGNRWVLCMQTYPIPRFTQFASQKARLWLVESEDLIHWGEPYMLSPGGCDANWTRSKRQIDPFIVVHDGKYWCFYKTHGNLGLLVSDNLKDWEEACPDYPVLSRKQTPDNSTIENPSILRKGNRFLMFFSPCRPGRGIGIAESEDLLVWDNIHYLKFPSQGWAPGGPTAPFVLDSREIMGKYLMAYHGDIKQPHAAALGLAWSDDLENWHVD